MKPESVQVKGDAGDVFVAESPNPPGVGHRFGPIYYGTGWKRRIGVLGRLANLHRRRMVWSVCEDCGKVLLT